MIHFFGFSNRSRRTAGKRRASGERGRHRRLRVESLESRQLLSVTAPSPGSQTVVAGDGPLNVALNGSDTAGDAVSYTVNVVSSSLSSPVTATVMPSSNPTMTIAVTGTNADGTKFSGDMVFSLFSNYVSAAVTPISTLVGKSFYNGLEFFRVISDFMGQTGSPTNNGQGGSGTSFDDAYNSNLQFTGPGILALANSGPNSNSSQFFITSPEETSPYTSGNFRYTIIGYLLSGSNILTDIMNVPVTTNSTTGFPDPNNPVTMTSVTMGTDNQDGVLQLSAPAGTTGSEVVTVTATSVENGVTQTATSSQFTVSVSPQNYTDPPYIDRPVSPITTTVGKSVDFTIPATNVSGGAVTYAATPANSTMTTAAVTSASSPDWSLNPSTLGVGVYSLTESVTAASPAGSENTAADTEAVPVYVDPAAPTGVTLVPGSGATSTTITDLNNTSGKTLEFDVTGVTSGDTVDVYADGTLIGSAGASGSSVDVTTYGTFTLTAGTHSITATQTLEDQTVSVGNTSSTTNLASANSSALSLTVDTTPPVFNSTPISSATVGVAYSYKAMTATDSAGAVTYSLISPVTGMTINSSTGLIQWTPSSLQGPTVNVDVQATDPAGNTAQQTFTIDVANTNHAPVLTAASPSLGTTDLNAPLVVGLSSFINNGSGTTIITDQDTANPVGGIAVTAVSGTGTWEYSLDGGKTFQDIEPSSSTLGTTNALLLPKDAWIKFVPSGSAAETATITYCAWDTTSGTAGSYASVTSNGGSTAFSTASDTASLNVAAVTDSVVLTAAHPSLGSTLKSAALTINLNGTFINNGAGTTTISTTNTGGTAGIAVVGFTGKGTWSFATSVGGAFTAFSTLNPSLSAPLLLGPGAELQYTPDGSDSETPTITYYAWDGTHSSGASGTTGGSLSATGATGDNTAFSLASDTASLTVNDAPALAAIKPSLGSTTAGAAKTISLSTFINNGSGTTVITDADTNAVLGGIAVTGVTGSGAWAYSLDGANFTNMSTPSTSAALLLPATASLRYTPNGESETATITYCAWDQTSGQAGTTAATTTNGGTTAFSADSDTASLRVNDAPVLTAASTSPSLGSTPANVAKTISLAGAFINNGSGTTTTTDADSNALLGGIALTGTTGKGTWAYELSGQTTFTNVGTVVPDAALLLPSSATLQYTPDGSDAESPTITYRAWDQTTGVAGTTADTTADGGTTAFSTATDTATLTVTASNIAPVLTAASPSLGQTALTTAKTITLASFINNGSGTTAITDSTPNAVVGGIALTGTTGAGTWAYELSGQTSFTNVGTVSTTSALLLPKNASLRYTPNGAAESATITFCAWDTSSGTAGSTADTTANGGSTAFSTASDTATLTVGAYASLAGYVYIDPANSGVWTASSEGLGGVTVRLLLENSSGTFTEVAGKSPIQTSADGSYSFSSLAAGTYEIQETPKPEFEDGQNTLGSLGGTNPQTDTFQVPVTAGQSGTGYNFAVQGVVSQMVSLRDFSTSNATMTGVELEQSLETAPSVNLARSSPTLSPHGSSVAIASSAASIASPDSPTLVSMTVTLTNPQDGSEEQLQAVTAGTSITPSYDDATGVLSLQGVADTSTYQTVLESITYSDTAASPTAGDRTIDVVVDDGVLSSNTAVSTVDVLPAGSGATTTTATSSDSTVVFGQSVTLTATVSPSSGSVTPTGTVTFTNGGTTLGTGTLSSSGVATLSTTALAEGSDTVTASYGGDATYATSSDTLTETVNRAATTTALSTSPTSAVFGQAVTLTATVRASSPGAGTPTGTVTFTDGSTTLGTGTLSGGVATFSTTTLPVGSDSITASYGGDTDFTTSSGTATETVSQAASTTAVGISPASAVSGQSLTVTATVSASSPGAGTPTGTVTFTDGSTTLGTGTLSGGVATFSTTTLSVGSDTITASYGGDTNFTTSSGTATETVGQAVTTTALSDSINPAASGKPVTFTATVSVTSPGSGLPPSGETVTFLDGTTTLGTGTLNSSGVATFTTSTLTLGSHSITASYPGDTNFDASTSSPALTETINAVGTTASTTLVTAAPSPGTAGQSVAFTATVSPETGSGTPTGTVTFTGGGITPDTESLTDGVATFTTSTLSAGTYTITASYSGDATYAASSNTVGETINAATTATTAALTASANPAGTDGLVIFTATVSPATGSGTPTGTVTFLDDSTTPATTLGTGTLDSSGVATFSTLTLTAGSHSVTASYPGDSNFGASVSPALPEVVSGTTSTLAELSASPSPANVGQLVTLTAVVIDMSGAAGTPTGTVTFLNDNTTPAVVLGRATLDDSTGLPTATFSTSTLSVGSYTITADYSGNGTYAGSSNQASEEIDAVGTTSTTTALTASPSSANAGQSVTFTATVSPAAATGTVTFTGSGITPDTETLTDGVATFSTSALPAGSDNITATYDGDPTYAVSSGSFSETINAVGDASTTTTATASPSSSVYGQSVTLTATVSDPTGAGTPTGTVTFSDIDGVIFDTENLVSGALGTATATFVTSALPVDTIGDTITATYNGDPTYAAGSNEVSETIGQAATTTKLTSSANPALTGQQVTFTAAVAASSPGSGTPTGPVNFYDNGTLLGPGALNSSGVATFTTNTLAQGDQITAVYQGDPDFTSSPSNTITETVNPVGTTATLTVLDVSANPTIVGQPVTLTAAVIDQTGSGTPTGTVTFLNGTTVLDTETLDPSSGIATFTTSTLPQGTGSITASYSGDATYAASSDSVSEEIDQVGTTASATTVTPSDNPAVLNQSVTFTATVSDPTGTGTPTGTVTFTGSGITPDTESLTGGVATFSTSTLPLGSDPVTATYSGDATYAVSSDTLTETIQQPGTTTTLNASPNPSAYGQSVTLTATVSGPTGAGTPTGTVTFTTISGGTTITLGSDIELTGGVATVNTSALPTGSDTITASYSGDATYAVSSGSTPETVQQSGTITTLTSSANPALTGQYVTFTATVAASSPGSGAPAGSVNFYDNGSLLGPGTLNSSGVATFTTTALAQGDQITATYQGDSNFTTSPSNTITETVNPVGNTQTITTVTPVPNPGTAGQSVAFAATVQDATDTGLPAGTVTFLNGTTVLDTVTLATAGLTPSTGSLALFSTSTLGAGDYTITAVYSGDSTYAASTSPAVLETINPAVKSDLSPTAVDNALGQDTNWLQS